MPKRKFPALGVLLLIFALAWLLQELEILDINIPWIPVVLIVIALAMIINRYTS